MSRLNKIQQWVQDFITQPQMEYESNQEEYIDKIISPSNALTSHERINIYQRSYFTRLLDCFKSDYNGLLNAVGDELFNHFVWSYLQKHPSISYTLNDLGKDFPDFLQSTLEESLEGDTPESWQLFIIDITKYERTFNEVFNGPGHEELTSNDILNTNPVKISPAVKVLQLNFPIAECIHDFRKDKTNSFPEFQKTNYVFTRRNYCVEVEKITKNECDALQRWIQNKSENCPIEFEMDWTVKEICYF
jgi:hypothetical protein